jgi:hypothetical protein
MVHALSIWLLIAGFFGAGLINAIGTSGTQSDFARWGYPPLVEHFHWWTGDHERRSNCGCCQSRCWPGAWRGHHCGCGLDRSTSPRFFAPCATQCLCRLDCYCRDLVLSADIANQTLRPLFCRVVREPGIQLRPNLVIPVLWVHTLDLLTASSSLFDPMFMVRPCVAGRSLCGSWVN